MLCLYIYSLDKYSFLAQVQRRQGRVVKQAVTRYGDWHNSFWLIDIYFYWTRLQSLTQLLIFFPLTLFKRLVDFGDGKKLDRPTKIQKIIVNIKRCWGVLIKRDVGCKRKLTNSSRSRKTEVRSLIIGLDRRELEVSYACLLFRVIFIYEAFKMFERNQNYFLLISGKN